MIYSEASQQFPHVVYTIKWVEAVSQSVERIFQVHSAHTDTDRLSQLSVFFHSLSTSSEKNCGRWFKVAAGRRRRLAPRDESPMTSYMSVCFLLLCMEEKRSQRATSRLRVGRVGRSGSPSDHSPTRNSPACAYHMLFFMRECVINLFAAAESKHARRDVIQRVNCEYLIKKTAVNERREIRSDFRIDVQIG